MRSIRRVPVAHAFAWYADAMRLWKRGPLTFCAIALAVLAANLALNLVPVAGIVVAQLVLPLMECGLLYASLAADRGDRPRLAHVVAVLGAPPAALAAVIVAGLVVFAVEALVAHAVGSVDLLAPAASDSTVTAGALIATYAAGIAISLPLTFVPFAALFDGAGFRAAFGQSLAAFARNPLALALWGALSFALLLLGLATSGLGLLLALPWSATSAYAAWKDLFDVA